MNINLIEHLAKTVTPALLGAAVDKSESSMLNQLFAILLGRFTDGGVTSKVFDAYNKLTSNGSINPSDLSVDSLSSLSSLVWKDDSQADSIVSNLAENHGIGAGKVKGLMASALPLVLGQLKGLAGDKSVDQYLSDQPTDQESSFTNYIPNWAMSMLPAGLLGAGAVAANAISSKADDPKPAYASSSNSTSTKVTHTEKKDGGFLKGLLPLLGLLLLALLAFFLLKGCPGGDKAPAAAVEQTQETAADVDPSALYLAVDEDGKLSASAKTGNQGVADTIKESLAGVFGDAAIADADITVSDKRAADLPVSEKLDDALNLIKGVPGATASIVGTDIKVNAPDAVSRDKLVGDLKGLLPNFTVTADDKLNFGELIGNGIDAVTDGAEVVVDGAADATGAVADGAEAVVDGVAGTLASWFTNPDDLAIAEKLNMQIIHFNTNGDAISGENQAILDNAVDAMTKLADAKLAVTGYTDVRGDEAYNQALSLERAESVKDYLVSKGVAADRITTAGAGETTEFSAADTAEGLYENRRITFAVSK